MTVANAKGPSKISSDTDRLLRYARFDLVLPSSERVVSYPDRTAFFENYFRIAGNTTGTPEFVSTLWIRSQAIWRESRNPERSLATTAFLGSNPKTAFIDNLENAACRNFRSAAPPEWKASAFARCLKVLQFRKVEFLPSRHICNLEKLMALIGNRWTADRPRRQIRGRLLVRSKWKGCVDAHR